MKFYVKIESTQVLMHNQDTELGVEGVLMARKTLDMPGLNISLIDSEYIKYNDVDTWYKYIAIDFHTAKQSHKFCKNNVAIVRMITTTLPPSCICKDVITDANDNTGEIRKVSIYINTDDENIIKQWIAAGYPDKLTLK